jgi:hypothetical protein
MRACYEDILEEKKRSLSLQTAALDFLKSTSGTCVSPSVLLDTANEEPDDLPTVNSPYLFSTYNDDARTNTYQIHLLSFHIFGHSSDVRLHVF